MPGEVIDRPNPPALPSHLPEFVDQLIVKLERTTLKDDAIEGLKKWQRAANYIAAGTFSSPTVIRTDNSGEGRS
jgi:xylulose-5-phosphate/fructose-6-phosphate phosphoketolase